jgi:hypothetical protein
MYFVAGAVPGFLAMLVERKERRREITIFMISVLLEQFWRMGVARKIVSPIKYGEVILFSLVMGVMNYLFTFEKECMGNSETAMAMIVGDKDKPDRVESVLQRYIGFRGVFFFSCPVAPQFFSSADFRAPGSNYCLRPSVFGYFHISVYILIHPRSDFIFS